MLVNWVWHKYFGRGLVPTLEDFGTQGEKPSHPELLDWLADEFMRRGWSLKALHKTHRHLGDLSAIVARDGRNCCDAIRSTCCWPGRRRLRLEAEVMRDVTLAASGLLTRTIGGPSVRPPQPPASRN